MTSEERLLPSKKGAAYVRTIRKLRPVAAAFGIAAIAISLNGCDALDQINLGDIVQVSRGETTTQRDRSRNASVSIADSERLKRIDDVLQAEVDAGRRAGFVAMVATSDAVAYSTAIGSADIAGGRPMTVDTRFRIASMTKPVVSAAAMRLVEEGRLALNDPVKMYIPAFANPVVATDGMRGPDGTYPTRPAKRDILVRDLLTHTAGLGYAFLARTDLDKEYLAANPFFTEGDLDARIERIAALPLYFDPGERWFYSYATDVLGRVVEVASGMELGAYAKQAIFDPLNMTDTFFLIDDADVPGLATVYTFDEAGNLTLPDPVDPNGQGIAVDINAQAFGVASGGGGLVSTAPDYIRFCRMLLNDGELDGARILSGASVRAMFTNQLLQRVLPQDWQDKGYGFGLGGQVIMKPGLTGEYDAPGDWRWGGYWDTSFVVNKADDVAVVLLTQREPGPNDPGTNAGQLVRSIAYSAATGAE
ncbi:MAG: serine hydrolase [Alphaproteobacteria bacterium]|nr:serine hydrolase [Alphaproteobacteria bacterium]